MKVFYIPDGHRRYADKVGCTQQEAYRIGYHVLYNELIEPMLTRADVERLDVFLLSNLNLRRRASEDLRVLLEEGEPMLRELIERCAKFASVRTVGSYLPQNICRQTVPDRLLTLVIGCTVDSDVDCGEVDLFLRTGGEIRLSGAPRSIIGNYTQFYGIDELHPELRFHHVQHCLEQYEQRYVREREK